jgi:peptide/nickel transport system permease protein
MPFWTQRLVRTLVALALILVITFLFVHLVPGDPARAILGPQASADSVSALHAQLGLDKPLSSQFVSYVSRLARGDLGQSISQGVSIRSLMWSRVTPTVLLLLYAALMTIVFTVPLAVLAAVKRGSALDHTIRIVPLVGLGLPAFWFSLMLINYLAVKAGLFPAGGYGDNPIEHLRSLTLPAFVIAISILPFTIQSLRVAMVDSLEADYVAAARARGVPGRRVLFAYGVRNAAIPAVVVLGLNMGWLVGNTLIVEKVFAIPGIGSLLIDATLSRDFPVVQGLALVIAILVIVTNILTELTRILLDPQLRVPQGSMR